MKETKKECIYCKTLMDDTTSICPHCHKDNNVDRLTTRGVHVLHQNAHNNISLNGENKDQALVFIVIGSILVIVASLFLVLSFKFNFLRIRVFSPISVEFFTCIACFAIAVVLFSLGIPKLIKANKAIKFYNNVIQSTGEKK